MDINRILKYAFVFSIAIYAIVALVVAGPPRWDSQWVPADETHKVLLAVLGFLALGTWTAGWMVGHMKDRAPEGQYEALMRPKSPFQGQRFILAAALMEAGALYGLALSLVIKDSRYAIVFAVPAAVLLYLTPVDGATEAGPGS
jgi:hypothetical protein